MARASRRERYLPPRADEDEEVGEDAPKQSGIIVEHHPVTCFETRQGDREGGAKEILLAVGGVIGSIQSVNHSINQIY